MIEVYKGLGEELLINKNDKCIMIVEKNNITLCSGADISINDLDKINFIIQRYKYTLDKIEDYKEDIKLEIENFNLLNKGV